MVGACLSFGQGRLLQSLDRGKPQKIIAVFLIMTAATLLLITVLPELDSLLKKKAVLA